MPSKKKEDEAMDHKGLCWGTEEKQTGGKEIETFYWIIKGARKLKCLLSQPIFFLF